MCSADKSRVAVSKNLAPPPSDDDDEEEDDEPTPAPNRIRKGPPVLNNSGVARVREAARRVVEATDMRDPDSREDSIMDSSDEEDADEVDDLLG